MYVLQIMVCMVVLAAKINSYLISLAPSSELPKFSPSMKTNLMNVTLPSIILKRKHRSQDITLGEKFRPRAIIVIVLLLGGDVETNPGPRQCSTYPCGICELHVDWGHRALGCENCDVWYHKSCIDLNTLDFNDLVNRNVTWICYKCHTHNYSCNLFHSYELDPISPTQNRFAVLDNESVFSSPMPGSQLLPSRPRHSSPKTPTQPTAPSHASLPSVSSISSYSSSNATSNGHPPRTEDQLCAKKNNWRTLTVNCNGVANKQAELQHIIEYTNPDVLLLTETKVDSTIKSSEFMPQTYKCFRKDRKRGGGGVLVAVKSYFPSEQVDVQSECETVWASIDMRYSRKLYVGAFYRPPDKGAEPLDELDNVIGNIQSKCKNNSNATIILGGDFNAPDINWESGHTFNFSKAKPLHERLIEIFQDHHLTQLQRDPTRHQNVLDLYATNKPGLVKTMSTIPGISDHEIIVADCDIKPHFAKKKSRKVYSYKNADWRTIRTRTREFANSFLNEMQDRTVEDNWMLFKRHMNKMMEEHMPAKLTSTRNNPPWLTNSLKRMCRKKQRRYNKAKRTLKEDDWRKFYRFKKETLRAIRKAHWDHVNSILVDSIDQHDSKPFWRYIKSRRQENFGIAALKKDGALVRDAKSKAEILNQQFKSVFTQSNPDDRPQLQGEEYPPIEDLAISEEGVLKLLLDIKVNKASGPDNVPGKFLKEMARPSTNTISHILVVSCKR